MADVAGESATGSDWLNHPATTYSLTPDRIRDRLSGKVNEDVDLTLVGSILAAHPDPLPDDVEQLMFLKLMSTFQSRENRNWWLTSGFARDAQFPYKVLRLWLDRDSTRRFLPEFCHNMVAELAISGHRSQDEAENYKDLFTFVLDHPKITVGHLGTFRRYVTARAGETLGREFDTSAADLDHAPFRLKLDVAMRWAGLLQEMSMPEFALAAPLPLANFTQQFAEEFPNFAGFPTQMQVKIALQRREHIPYPEEWHQNAF